MESWTEGDDGDIDVSSSDEDESAAWDRAALLASFSPPRWVAARERASTAIERRRQRALLGLGHVQMGNSEADTDDENDDDDDDDDDADYDEEEEEEEDDDDGDDDERDSDSETTSFTDSPSALSASSWTGLSDAAVDAANNEHLVARMDRMAQREASVSTGWARTEDILKGLEWGGRTTWRNELMPEETHAFGRDVRRRTEGGRRDGKRMSQLSGGSTTASPRSSMSLSMYDFEKLTQDDIIGMADDVKIATVHEHMLRADVRDTARAAEILGDYVSKREKEAARVARQQAAAEAAELRRRQARDAAARAESGDDGPTACGEQDNRPTAVTAKPSTPPQPEPEPEPEPQGKVPMLHDTVEQRPILAPTGCFRACLHTCTCRDILPPPQVPKHSRTTDRATGKHGNAESQNVADGSKRQMHAAAEASARQSEADQVVREQHHELTETRKALLERLAKARELVRSEEIITNATTISGGGRDGQQLEQQRLTGFSKGIEPPQPLKRSSPMPPPSSATQMRARGLRSLSSGDVSAAASAATAAAAAVGPPATNDSANARTSLTNFRLPPALGVERPPPRPRGVGASISVSAALGDQTAAQTQRRSPKSAEERVMQVLAEGNEALAHGRHDTAVELFERALQICPGHASLASRLAHARSVKREVNRVVGQWMRVPGASGVGSKRPSPSATHALKVAERCATPVMGGLRPRAGHGTTKGRAGSRSHSAMADLGGGGGGHPSSPRSIVPSGWVQNPALYSSSQQSSSGAVTPAAAAVSAGKRAPAPRPSSVSAVPAVSRGATGSSWRRDMVRHAVAPPR
jgi:hypothetical protein